MKKKYIQPVILYVALHQQTHLLIGNVQDVGGNVGLKYGGASSGDVDARTKGNEWDHTWE
jgi:hypothetical protein